MILLCGAPGLGKTTLAHIAAKHCGYNVVEINASDDRTAKSLRSKVMNAVEMQSVLGAKRPNCVVIDEIDGAQVSHSAASLCCLMHTCSTRHTPRAAISAAMAQHNLLLTETDYNARILLHRTGWW